MWTELIKELTQDCKFYVPVTESQMLEVENSMNIELPV
ncbi:MAG: hypothetical protein K0R47_5475, partial [Brevibacillus sp.]|nr:hypothetical protein [Brevibacillus sp.]